METSSAGVFLVLAKQLFAPSSAGTHGKSRDLALAGMGAAAPACFGYPSTSPHNIGYIVERLVQLLAHSRHGAHRSYGNKSGDQSIFDRCGRLGV